jgi:hypothetical protein
MPSPSYPQPAPAGQAPVVYAQLHVPPQNGLVLIFFWSSQVKNYSPAHGVGGVGCVLVRAMNQPLNGCVGWVYVRGRCAFRDLSLSLSQFIATGACLALCLPRALKSQ